MALTVYFVVVVVLVLNRSFYPTSAVHPVSVLIIDPIYSEYTNSVVAD